MLLVVVNNQEEVPYTHRRHVVLTSNAFDKQLGEEAFKQVVCGRLCYVQITVTCGHR